MNSANHCKRFAGGEWRGEACAIMQIQRKQKFRQIADKTNYKNVYRYYGDANFYSSSMANICCRSCAPCARLDWL